MIGLMSDAEIDAILARHKIGRLGCCANDRPYVVPINYAFDGLNIFGYSAPGRKIEIMREQPLVAFEVDEIDNDTCWRSVLVEGRFYELSGRERNAAINRLSTGNDLVAKSLSAADRIIIYRISVDERSGRFESIDS
jgi:nitroimidazol reductase NimA-like FMN-containing flavoprotein (pyridoxamine 5'-phosphate oxidase superfamily)